MSVLRHHVTAILLLSLAAIESMTLKGAVLAGVKVAGATSYGYTLQENDELPT